MSHTCIDDDPILPSYQSTFDEWERIKYQIRQVLSKNDCELYYQMIDLFRKDHVLVLEYVDLEYDRHYDYVIEDAIRESIQQINQGAKIASSDIEKDSIEYSKIITSQIMTSDDAVKKYPDMKHKKSDVELSKILVRYRECTHVFYFTV
jgi:hypothetical protein